MEEQQIPEKVEKDSTGISTYVQDLFLEFRNGRRPYEDKAEEWWNNFLSQYQSTKTWRNKEGEGNRSRIFIKLTQQKCYTAHAKTMDALGADIPFDFEALENLNYGDIPRDAVEFAALFRKRYIADYLKYIKFFDTLDDSVLDATIFPAAIIKGPILIMDRQPVVQRRMIAGIPAEELDTRMSPFMVTTENIEKYVFETVPFWDYYVDTNAKNTRRSIGEIHYKRMLPQEFRELQDDPGYDQDQMKLAIANIDLLKSDFPDMDKDKTDKQQGDKFMGFEVIKDSRIPVVEFHGLIKAELLRAFGSDVPENIRDSEDCEACIAMVDDGRGTVIKARYNYYGYRPFMVFGVKKIPNCVYKHSIAGLIDDSQSMVNSGARMYIDNKALSGNGCLAIHEDKINWQKTGSAAVYPRKTFYLKGNSSAREAIENVNFPDVTLGIKDMVQMFMQIADEESGIPKYSQGDGQASYLNKTATGISMIMGAANVNLKPFLKNIDDNVIEPVVERLDSLFSMLGLYPPQVNIPLKAVATGTISMMARELIVENMIKLLQITQNPQDAIILRRRELLLNMAEKMGLSKFVKTDSEIQKIEQMMAERQAAQPIQSKGEVAVDKLFPNMTPYEQAQVLQSVGLQPDPQRMKLVVQTPAEPPQAQSPLDPNNLPAGYHQMPDGSIMADSAMTGGGQ